MAGIKDYNLFFERLRDFDGKIILYGAGKYGKLTHNALMNLGVEVHSFCDSNIKKVGSIHCGRPIIGVDDLINYKDYMVIICIYDTSWKEQNEIAEKLINLGMKNVFNISLQSISIKNFEGNIDKIKCYVNSEELDYFSYNLLKDSYSKDVFTKWCCYRYTKSKKYFEDLLDKEFLNDEFCIKYDMIDEFKSAFSNLSSATVYMEYDDNLEQVLVLFGNIGFNSIKLYKNANNLAIKGEK